MRAQELKKFCTAAECKLAQSSSPREIGKLTPTRLRSSLERAEGLASARPQKAGKLTAADSKAKARAFAEVAKRFKARLAKLERPGRTGGAKKKTAKKAARRPTRAASAGDTGRTSTRNAAPRRTGAARAGTARPGSSGRSAPRAAKQQQELQGHAMAVAVAPEAAGAAPRDALTPAGSKPSGAKKLLEHRASPVGQAANGALHANGNRSNLNDLISQTEARNTAFVSHSEQSVAERKENLLAASANARIRGHASGASRRAQGRRDAQQRGEKRPDMGNVDG